jgi:hypothetical protein
VKDKPMTKTTKKAPAAKVGFTSALSLAKAIAAKGKAAPAAKPARKGTRSLSTAEAVRKLAKAPAVAKTPAQAKADARWERALQASKEGIAAKAAAEAASAVKAAQAASKPAKAAKPAKPAEAIEPLKYRGVWAEVAEAAAKGKVPATPDFTKPTHAGYRKRLANLVALVAAGDLPGLAAADMQPPASSSRLALWRYRDLAMIALRAQAAAGKAKAKAA